MVVLCLGPVCVPLHLLLPFLLALAHQRGYLLFIKREWLTLRYWRERIAEKRVPTSPTAANPTNTVDTELSLAANTKGKALSPDGRETDFKAQPKKNK